MRALDLAIESVGGAAALARSINVASSLPSMWRARGEVPSDRCPAIERATDGKATVEQLRPDVRWVRVPDPSWPHPEGRPCIDVAAPAQQSAA